MSENVQKNAQKWSANQERFIAWLAIPSQVRKPPTQGSLAEELGVNERTLSRWKKIPGLVEEAAKLARDSVTSELPDIYGVLIQHAKRGKYHHIKLCLEVAGHYVEKRVMAGDANAPIRHEHQHEHRAADFSKFSDEELDAYIALQEKLLESADRDPRRSAGEPFPSPN